MTHNVRASSNVRKEINRKYRKMRRILYYGVNDEITQITKIRYLQKIYSEVD